MCGRPLESKLASLATLACLILFRIGPEMFCGLRDMPVGPIQTEFQVTFTLAASHTLQAINRAYLSSTARISSRLRSGIMRIVRSIRASRYSARIAASGGGANMLIDRVEKS